MKKGMDIVKVQWRLVDTLAIEFCTITELAGNRFRDFTELPNGTAFKPFSSKW